MKINVLEILEANSYLIKSGILSNHIDYYLNKNLLPKELCKNSLTISKKDVFEYMPNSKELIGYERGKEKLTVEDYKSKPQYYSDEHNDEYVLRAIANKKELEGFVPIYKDIELQPVEFEIYGNIADTGSEFIYCEITSQYSSNPILYSLNVNLITIDEYNILKNKHSDNATFEKLDRKYLRFAKINNKYSFGDHYPFQEISNQKSFTSLQKAKDEESKIREAVRCSALKNIFPKNLSDEKKIMIIAQLKVAKKLKNKKSMDEMINILIDDLQDYKKNVYVD